MENNVPIDMKENKRRESGTVNSECSTSEITKPLFLNCIINDENQGKYYCI